MTAKVEWVLPLVAVAYLLDGATHIRDIIIIRCLSMNNSVLGDKFSTLSVEIETLAAISASSSCLLKYLNRYLLKYLSTY